MDTIDKLIVENFKVDMSGHPPYRCREGNRVDLASFMGRLGYKSGAEIGVFRGAYSRDLCNCILGLHLKCVDPWLAFRRNSQAYMDGNYTRTCRRLKPFNAEIIRKTSMEAVRDIPDASLDFIYIDAMHEFDPVMLELISWSPKVKKGGMVSGHDYGKPLWWNGVKPSTDTYTSAHGIEQWYITCEIEPEYPSFFWIVK